MPRRKTHEEFLSQIDETRFEVLGQYVNSTTKIKMRCKTDGHIWMAIPDNLVQGSNCPVCGNWNRKQHNKRQNTVLEDHGDWLLLDMSTPKHPNATTKIDKECFSLFDTRIIAGGHGYPVVSVDGKLHVVHRIIANAPPGLEVDHINRDKTDNRRENLRLCSREENGRNLPIKTVNRSGIVGVSWDDRRRVWRSRIKVNYKSITLGSFTKIEDAIKARKEAEQKYFGEFTPKELSMADRMVLNRAFGD